MEKAERIGPQKLWMPLCVIRTDHRLKKPYGHCVKTMKL